MTTNFFCSIIILTNLISSIISIIILFFNLKGGIIIYEYQEVISFVEGLSSISTLKRWRKKAEELTGVTFKVEQIRIGKQSTQLIYTFTVEDIQKFQQVADTKEKLGLNKAIINAFTYSDKLPVSISERVGVLEQELAQQRTDFVNRINCLESQNRQFQTAITDLHVQFKRIETQPKGLRKLFQSENDKHR